MIASISIGLLENADIYSPEIILLLITAGFFVGFINTIAGSGTVISYSLFMMLGLPANIANGTIRIGVVLQTLAATLNFKKHNKLDLKKGLKLALPVIAGSIAGAQIAVHINENIFEKILAFVLISMLFFIFYKPEHWVKDKLELIERKTTFLQVLIFFAIGLYGGFIHIGVGIFLLSAIVLNAGYDLVKANAIKVMIVFLYSPFALLVFILSDHVNFEMGLISAIGNIAGGLIGSKLAIKKGAGFIRWILVGIIVFFTIYLLLK